MPVLHENIYTLYKWYKTLVAIIRNPLFKPPGHYYSPIPSLDEIKGDESKIFGSVPRNIIGIELHEAEQLKLFNEFVAYYDEMPFQLKKREGLRFCF